MADRRLEYRLLSLPLYLAEELPAALEALSAEEPARSR
jgi:hypothetical protein